MFQKKALLKAIILGCLAFVFGTFFTPPVPLRSESFLTNRSPILLYDYEIKGNQLTYFYWNFRRHNNDCCVCHFFTEHLDPGYTVLATYMLYPVVVRQNNNNNDDSIDIDIISGGGGAAVR